MFHFSSYGQIRLGLSSVYLYKAFIVFTFALDFNLLILKVNVCFLRFIALTLHIVLVSALNSVCLHALLSFKVFGVHSCHYSEPCFVTLGTCVHEFICKMCSILFEFI